MSTNPQGGKSVNQKRGPTTGNAGNATKRSTFMSEKAATGSERATIANMITDALSMRGRGTQATNNPALEGLHSNTGPKSNPTANGSKLPKKFKK